MRVRIARRLIDVEYLAVIDVALRPKIQETTLARRLAMRLDTRGLLTGAALFALFSTLFAFVQFGTAALADNDGFYHLRMAALVRQYGLRVPFTWLPLSILNQDAFYDHHLLYHVYLSFFAGGSDQAMVVATKWASIFMPAAAFVAIWWLLRGQQVRYAAVWALGLFAVSEAFLYRMSMPRAQAASLLVLALGLHWLGRIDAESSGARPSPVRLPVMWKTS